MNKKDIAVFAFDIVMAFAFVVVATYDAAEGSGWLSIAAILAIGISIIALVGVVILAEWKRPADYESWDAGRLRRSYERNLGFAKQWLNISLGFAFGTVAALIPWLWNLGSKADELSPWRVTIVAAVALLLVVASGSFLMYAKYKQFYEEDDANLIQGNERRP